MSVNVTALARDLIANMATSWPLTTKFMLSFHDEGGFPNAR
jgi:hypothetical protein